MAQVSDSQTPVKPVAALVRRKLSWQQTFAALKYPNYRLWFFGQMVSLMGTWMQSTAQGFLVFQLTHSPAFLGYVGFAAGVPSWLFMLYGGVIADRIPRRDLLVVTQNRFVPPGFGSAMGTPPLTEPGSAPSSKS